MLEVSKLDTVSREGEDSKHPCIYRVLMNIVPQWPKE